MDKPSASRKSGETLTGQRIREVPTTTSPEDKPLPTFCTSQPPETTGGGSHSRIIRKATCEINQGESEEEEMDSTSSSSLGPSSGEESEAKRGIMMRSLGLSNRPGREEINRVIEGVAADANREIQEIERRRKRKSVETPEGARAQRRIPRQIAGIHDLTETDDEEEVAPRGWKNLMEEVVGKLIEVSAAQHELMEGQKRQMTKVVDLIDRMTSWMKREHQPSHPTK